MDEDEVEALKEDLARTKWLVSDLSRLIRLKYHTWGEVVAWLHPLLGAVTNALRTPESWEQFWNQYEKDHGKPWVPQSGTFRLNKPAGPPKVLKPGERPALADSEITMLTGREGGGTSVLGKLGKMQGGNAAPDEGVEGAEEIEP